MRLLALDNRCDLDRELDRVGVDPCTHDIFAAKHNSLAIKLDDLSVATANILKQTALTLGGDCAVHRRVITGKVKRSDAVLFVTRRQLAGLLERLKHQPECVSRLVPELRGLVTDSARPDLAIRLGRRKLDLGARTFVMGILNVTPDSFYDGGRYSDIGAAAERAAQMADEGADFIDVGAESTKPGAEPVPSRTQLKRLLPVLEAARRKLKVPVSVDTTSARVAKAAIGAGAAMVNDISGLTFDRRMAGVVAEADVPCVVMHILGSPRTMQRKPAYDDLMAEVIAFLAAALERGKQAGIRRTQLIVDPGIGFGKSLRDSHELLRRLGELRTLGRPILVGPSRKSFIGKTLGLDPDERLEGTLAACVVAAHNGASILRVHDVKAAKRALTMVDAIGMAGKSVSRANVCTGSTVG